MKNDLVAEVTEFAEACAGLELIDTSGTPNRDALRSRVLRSPTVQDKWLSNVTDFFDNALPEILEKNQYVDVVAECDPRQGKASLAMPLYTTIGQYAALSFEGVSVNDIDELAHLPDGLKGQVNGLIANHLTSSQKGFLETAGKAWQSAAIELLHENKYAYRNTGGQGWEPVGEHKSLMSLDLGSLFDLAYRDYAESTGYRYEDLTVVKGEEPPIEMSRDLTDAITAYVQFGPPTPPDSLVYQVYRAPSYAEMWKRGVRDTFRWEYQDVLEDFGLPRGQKDADGKYFGTLMDGDTPARIDRSETKVRRLITHHAQGRNFEPFKNKTGWELARINTVFERASQHYAGADLETETPEQVCIQMAIEKWEDMYADVVSHVEFRRTFQGNPNGSYDEPPSSDEYEFMSKRDELAANGYEEFDLPKLFKEAFDEYDAWRSSHIEEIDNAKHFKPKTNSVLAVEGL